MLKEIQMHMLVSLYIFEPQSLTGCLSLAVRLITCDGFVMFNVKIFPPGAAERPNGKSRHEFGSRPEMSLIPSFTV